MRFSRFLCTVSVLILAGCAAPRGQPLERFEYRQIHMGVEARIVLFAPDSARAIGAAREAFARIAALDARLSDYRDDSELMRLSRHPVGQPVPVSDPLWRVLEEAQALARISSGAFDITVGPTVQLWREARRTGAYPAPDALAEARARTGWRHLRLDPTARTATLLVPGMRLDPGGIAKGFAADEAVAALREHGITRALVEMGGDIVVGAPPPGRSGWDIRIADAGGAPSVVEIAGAAISTSGDAVQWVEIGGERYSHVIDPRTGVALRHSVAATVIAPSGVLSDGLSTLLGVLGPDEAPDFLREHFPGVRAWVRRIEPPVR
jgi:thiamine biosynthesis lipoprotein